MSRRERWRLGGRVPINVYGEPTVEWPEGRPICQPHHREDALRIVRAINRNGSTSIPRTTVLLGGIVIVAVGAAWVASTAQRAKAVINGPLP